jgi:outer membrane protein assembly factor BamA
VLALVLSAGICRGAIPVARVVGLEVHSSAAIQQAAATLGLEKDLGLPLSDQLVMRGVAKLKRIGRAAGVKVDFRTSPAGLWISYRVRENPKITSIDFTGNTLMTRQELLKDLKLQPGDVLDYGVLYREVNRIPEVYLARKGVLYAGVLTPSAVEVRDGKIVIAIQEFKLRSLEVRGVGGRLKNAVMASLKLRRGQALRRSELLGGLFNVYQLPRIKDIDYRPLFDTDKGEITLVVTLAEEGVAKASPADHGKLN